MSKPYDFNSLRADFMSLPLEQQHIFQQALVRYAHADRTRQIRAALHSVLTWPWHAVDHLTRRFGAALIRWWRERAERRARLRGAAELAALSDRDLWDIGLSRCEIQSVVQHGRETPRRTPAKGSLTLPRSDRQRDDAPERKRAA